MDREILFAKTLEQVRKQGKIQGNRIGKEQVREAFAELSLEESQLELVYDYLEKHHIGVDREASGEENLTAEETDYLQEYLEMLQAIPELPDGEREALFLSAMAGDLSSQKRLTEVFLPKVPEMARIYAGQGVYLEDLIGQGNMALSEGVAMLGAAENAQDAEGMLAWFIMDSMEKQLAEDLRRKVTVGELAEETGIPEEEIRDVYRLSGYVIEDLEDKQ